MLLVQVGIQDAGVKEAEAPEGNPEAVNVTAGVPPTPVTKKLSPVILVAEPDAATSTPALFTLLKVESVAVIRETLSIYTVKFVPDLLSLRL